MKHVILIAVFLCTAWLGQQVYAQQGFGTNAPDRSAAVDIVSTKRGLLIPRVALQSTTNGTSPIASPANSLFVYNTATTTTGTNDVTPGYYYWLAAESKWVRFVSSEDMKTSSVKAGTNIKVDTVGQGNNTEYTVSVKAGAKDGLVLVTKETSPGVFESVWVDPAVFVNDAIVVGNGLTKNAADSNRVELGGALNRATEITTTGTNTLSITGLDSVGVANKMVMVLDANGVLQKAAITSLVDANNGVSIGTGADEGKVQLGGALIQATEIDATGQTLAIKGLDEASAANKIVVANDGSGVLQTVARVLNYPIAADLDISNGADYNQYAQEVNVYATLPASGNIVVTLPSAVATQDR